MIPRFRVSFVAMVLALYAGAAAPAHAQGCLGYTPFASGPFNVSVAGRVGAEFWGTSADVNIGRRTGGLFGGAGVSTATYVTEPVETRLAFGASVGFQQQSRDQLIFCPFLSAAIDRGQDVERDGVPERTDGSLYAAGVGISAELQKRGQVSIDPFATIRMMHVRSVREFPETDSTSNVNQNGVGFAVGLEFRFRDAIQVTPAFSGSTLPGSDLVFMLRLSVALQRRQ